MEKATTINSSPFSIIVTSLRFNVRIDLLIVIPRLLDEPISFVHDRMG